MGTPRRIRAVLLGLAAVSAVPAAAQPRQGLHPSAVSVYLGGMEVDDQSVNIEDSTLLDAADLDFSTLPGGGIFVEMPLAGERAEVGIESGAGIAWRNDNTEIAGSSINGNTTVRVNIDNSFLLADLDMGLYARLHLGQAASIYVGGGPAAIYGRHEVGDQTVEPAPTSGTTVVLDADEGSDVNVGYYGRAGIDFEWQDGYRFGIGAKWLGATLDFDGTLGETDIDGVFYFLSFSQALD